MEGRIEQRWVGENCYLRWVGYVDKDKTKERNDS